MSGLPVAQPKQRAAAVKAQAALAQKPLPTGLVSVPASTPGGTAFVIGGGAAPSGAPYSRSPAAKPAADFTLSLEALSKAAESHSVPAAAEKPSKAEKQDKEEREKEREQPKRAKKAAKKDEDEKDKDADRDAEKEEKEKGQKRKRLFAKELKPMMYGFGDVANPLVESVDVMEELVLDYIQDMTTKAMQVATRRGKLQTEDLVFLIRKDRKKHARVKELLIMYDELKRARKAFDVAE